MSKKIKKGFSLLELMVIIVIIAILAGAGLGAANSYIKKGRDTARKKELKEVYNLVMQDLNQNKQKEESTHFVYSQVDFNKVFQRASFRLKPRGGFCYFVGMAPPQAGAVYNSSEFIIATWGESSSTAYPNEPGIIAVGTPQSLLNMTRAIGVESKFFKCKTPHFDILKEIFQGTV